MFKTQVGKCGGDLRAASVLKAKAGDIIPCPYCGKMVKLRMPFNSGGQYYVQIPRHNRANKEAQ